MKPILQLKPKMEYRIKITPIILLFLFIILVNLTSFSKSIKNFFYLISSPIQKNLWQAGGNLSIFFESITNAKELEEENRKLKEQNSVLLEKIVKILELEKENKVLREAFDAGLRKEFKPIVTQISGKDIASDSLIIDKGLKDGVVENSSVITQQKVLVGKIEKVYENFSKVILLYNKNFDFNIQILKEEGIDESNETRQEEIYGVVKGEGVGRLSLDKIPQDKELREGDIVITSNLGGVFPQGFLIGRLQKIKKSDVQPFQQAEVFIPFDIKDLQTLFIIK
ncbi:MAG: rod shape-determining protein MreC [Patescibacteria group bacterium]